jgi:uncharacterized protein YjbI with pentapeptide repeats
MQKYVNQLFTPDIERMLREFNTLDQLSDKFIIKNKELLPLLWKNDEVEDVEPMKKHICSELREAVKLGKKYKLTQEVKDYLAGVDLCNLKVNSKNLMDMNFAWTCLDGTEFSGCDLTRSQFGHASCVKTKFYGSDLSNTDFECANCTESKFYYTNLEHSRMDGANLTKAEIDRKGLGKIASLIGSKLFDLTNLNNSDSTTELHVKDIKPIKEQVVSQYKQLINDSKKIQPLIDIFNKARCDETLRIERPLFDSGKVCMGEEGKTASCKEVMHAVVEQLVEVVENMSKSGTLLDKQTAQDLVKLYKTADIGFSHNFFGKSSDLPLAIEKNQCIQPRASDQKSLVVLGWI